MMWLQVACGFLGVCLLISLVANWFLWRENVEDMKLLEDASKIVEYRRVSSAELTDELIKANQELAMRLIGRRLQWSQSPSSTAFHTRPKNSPAFGRGLFCACRSALLTLFQPNPDA